MKSKVENATPETPKRDFPFIKFFGPNVSMPSKDEMHQYLWNTFNFTTVAATTSASIVAVQSPVKTMLLNSAKYGSLIPVLPAASGGVFGLVRYLYKGTVASLSGSAVRTVYVTGAKGSKPPVEENNEGQVRDLKKKPLYSPPTLGYVLSAAFGDILITQIPESLSTLRKVPGLLPNDFKWRTLHNSYKLMSGGFVPRYLAGMVNFASLCVLEGEIAQRLPFENKNTTHSAAGFLSGVSAAILSYPFAAFKDYVMVKSTVNNGKLVNENALGVMKELTRTFVSNPKQAALSFVKIGGPQVFARAGLTGVIFGLVAGIGEALGSEPLKAVVPEKYQPSKPNPAGFFSGSKPAPKVEEVLDNTAETSPAKKAT